MAAKAKVTIDQAIKTASEKVAGKVVEAELEKKHDKLLWEVEVVTAENKVMDGGSHRCGVGSRDRRGGREAGDRYEEPEEAGTQTATQALTRFIRARFCCTCRCQTRARRARLAGKA